MTKSSGSHAVNEFTKAPLTAEGLTKTVREINAGANEFGQLSHPGRVALIQKVTQQWEQDFVASFHISDDPSKAGEEYAAIEQGDKYPNLSNSVREAVLRRFDDRHGDGGPRIWPQLKGN
ncbi:hypothetical protein [Glaciimonas immobilis]|uniref:Uncharacterized protein n=1 Tax=Glaciimonas immobilis TaxID=728004 RepID=A0A840RS37_9BURK|nr:hypothetical protein [Glaciimonas immobilis]KAF3996984.1 hypothetical protein HAV38_14985 [Glaciimonas immobilis]MBB5199818.1 hypothetical protein [Glaciimonas immobilis]